MADPPIFRPILTASRNPDEPPSGLKTRQRTRRRAVRRSRPVLYVRLGDCVVTSIDWSTVGLSVRAPHTLHQLLRAGNLVTGFFGLADDELAFRFDAYVVRTSTASGLIAFAFEALTEESRTMLDNLVRGPAPVRRLATRPEPKPVPLIKMIRKARTRRSSPTRQKTENDPSEPA
ncbi:MAG: PilZ domain-containing protein [Inquilinaceae bacterium]